jgi:hypothetical protein
MTAAVYVAELSWVALATSAATAAVEATATTAVEAASTGDVAVESAARVAVEGFTAVIAVDYCSATIAVRVGDWTTVDGASGVVAAAISVAVSAIAVVVPRAGSDKDSADEPVGTVVAVGGAGVGRVVIVAVRAYGRAIGVATIVGGRYADAYANRDLSVREGGWEDQDAE